MTLPQTTLSQSAGEIEQLAGVVNYSALSLVLMIFMLIVTFFITRKIMIYVTTIVKVAKLNKLSKKYEIEETSYNTVGIPCVAKIRLKDNSNKYVLI